MLEVEIPKSFQIRIKQLVCLRMTTEFPLVDEVDPVSHHVHGGEPVAVAVVFCTPIAFEAHSSEPIEVVIGCSTESDHQQRRDPRLQVLQMGLLGTTGRRVVLSQSSVEVHGGSEVGLLLLDPADEEVAEADGGRNVDVEELQDAGGRANHGGRGVGSEDVHFVQEVQYGSGRGAVGVEDGRNGVDGVLENFGRLVIHISDKVDVGEEADSADEGEDLFLAPNSVIAVLLAHLGGNGGTGHADAFVDGGDSKGLDRQLQSVSPASSFPDLNLNRAKKE